MSKPVSDTELDELIECVSAAHADCKGLSGVCTEVSVSSPALDSILGCLRECKEMRAWKAGLKDDGK